MNDTPSPPGAAEPRYINDMAVRETYADQLRMSFFSGQMLHLEFTASRPQMTGPNQSELLAVTAARLVLPTLALPALVEQLTKLLHSIENNGQLKRISAGVPTKQ
jgi:hypothetical protein